MEEFIVTAERVNLINASKYQIKVDWIISLLQERAIKVAARERAELEVKMAIKIQVSLRQNIHV